MSKGEGQTSMAAPQTPYYQEKFLEDCPKEDSRPSAVNSMICLERRVRAVLAGEQGWAGRYSSSRRSLHLVSEKRTFLTGRRIEGALRQLRERNLVWQRSWVLLGLGLYSYHVRELLVCWMFFGLLFALLVLVILLGVLAWHTAKSATHWAGTAGLAILLAKMKFRT
jgi:hypothetical protein